MSEKDHIISNPSDAQTGGLGKRFPQNYTSAYAASPVYKGEITDSKVEETFVKAVQAGDATSAFSASTSTSGASTAPRSDFSATSSTASSAFSMS